MTTGQKPQTVMPVIAGVLILVSEGIKLFTALGLTVVGLALFQDEIRLGLLAPLILIPVLALLVVAVIGGIFAIQRRYWGWALAGAIITAIPFSIFGLGSVVLLALSREEFH